MHPIQPIHVRVDLVIDAWLNGKISHAHGGTGSTPALLELRQQYSSAGGTATLQAQSLGNVY